MITLSTNIQSIIIKYLDWCEDQYVFKYINFQNLEELKNLWFKHSNPKTIKRIENDQYGNTFETITKYVGGRIHCDYEPALLTYSNFGNYKKDSKQYYQNNVLHREDGPAYVIITTYWDKTKKIEKEYYIKGIGFTKKEYWKKIRKNLL
jgi:hypothetical protein